MQKFFFFLLINFQILSTYGQTNYWQQQVDYIIDVSLNDKTNSLEGFEKITYINNSPDTLNYIWFHVWPNAYKNDKTAFTEQQLLNGITKFYFADKEEKGYINRLDFKVNGSTAKTEDHPQHIDIIKLLLPKPLVPKQQITITTPFYVKLPYTFSRGGYDKKSYQLTQWYPKPAVYDARGWHPMPYLDNGEFYSEFGNYDVRITLPKEYVVAATGDLQNKEELQWVNKKQDAPIKDAVKKAIVKKSTNAKKKPVAKNTATELLKEPEEIKTLQFKQDNVHDFALFANKDFIVNSDTCRLASGRIIIVSTYYTSPHKEQWKNSVQFCKDAVRFYSNEIGEYPYNTMSAVQGPLSAGGGMEYPTITIIAPLSSEKELDIVLAHEIGHNWFYSILATNERDHPWMDEGINSFYEKKYAEQKYGKQTQLEEIAFQTLAKTKKDQPITTSSDSFNQINYGLVAYHKTAKWLKLVEEKLGSETFKQTMQQYFETWKFKHPKPEDFKSIFAPQFKNYAAEIFALLDEMGTLPNQQLSGFKIITPLKPKTFKEYLYQPSKNALLISPALGFNNYDKLMIGGLITNYKLPPSPFQFLVLPLYGTGSKKLNGITRLGYSIYPNSRFQKIDFGMAGLFFSKNQHLDSNDNKVFERFTKITPSIRLTFKQPPKSTKESWMEARSYFIKEKEFSKFVLKSTNGLSYVDSSAETNRYVNQLTFSAANKRALYPYDYQFQIQQGKGFYRANLTGNYFFNYAKYGGASVRMFFSKFGYINKDESNPFSTFIYQPKLLGVTGEEDYTYSNYFLGRTASFGNDASIRKNSGLAAQQVMIRDGAMKLRIDQYEFLQGRSEDWVAAMNFTTTLPKNIFPIPIPLKLFLDVGTFSEAWKNDAQTSRFLYVGGLQLSLLKNIINIYAPIIYSNDFKTYLKTLPEQNKFAKKITFSIDIQRISKQTVFGNSFAF